MLLVMHAMRAHTVTAEPGTTIRDALDLMDLYQVVLLPIVTPDGEVLGVVTEGDLTRSLLSAFPIAAGGMGLGPTPQHLGEFGRRTLAEVATQPPICIEESFELAEAASLLQRHGIRRLPVTSGAKLVGMVGPVDICRAILEAG